MPRSSVDFLLSSLGPQTQAEALAYVELVFGLVVLVYWARGESEYERRERPLGITIIAVLNFLGGGLIVIEGFAFLFLPVPGIISFIILAIGVAIIYFGKGLREGRGWSWYIQIILYGITLIIGLIEITLRIGNPIPSIFGLWYLSQEHVKIFFGPPGTIRGLNPSPPAAAPGIPPPSLLRPLARRSVRPAGKRIRLATMYCFNCGLRMFPLPESPPSTLVEDQASVRLRLERVEDELRRMDRLVREGKDIDLELFKKAYEAKNKQAAGLKSKLSSSITPS